jgi:hypothetical protein
MSDNDIKELVKRLRAPEMFLNRDRQEAADKLEEMADLLHLLRSSYARFGRDHRDMLDIICAERDQLKAALLAVRQYVRGGPDHVSDDDITAVFRISNDALTEAPEAKE